jgi:hypothetical protein
MFRSQGGKEVSFAVGHIALGYLLAKASGRLFKVSFNIPLVLVLSLIPDIDILIQFFLQSTIHRGPTHSVVMAIMVFAPFFFFYRQKAMPYFAALVSHSLIGDFLIGGQVQLLWPISTSEFGINELGFPCINIYNPINIALEFSLFVIATIVMLKTHDLSKFFRNSKLNLILTIPIFTVLLPTFASYPLDVPLLLVFPHVFYLALFLISIIILVKGILK